MVKLNIADRSQNVQGTLRHYASRSYATSSALRHSLDKDNPRDDRISREMPLKKEIILTKETRTLYRFSIR